ncbi:MAG: hypothetical protein KatS3mg132_912 [Limisphaera sp.]|nr:MAG: hypothetical protein KatS3mg132_912 [Limisphaera sp.]
MPSTNQARSSSQERTIRGTGSGVGGGAPAGLNQQVRHPQAAAPAMSASQLSPMISTRSGAGRPMRSHAASKKARAGFAAPISSEMIRRSNQGRRPAPASRGRWTRLSPLVRTATGLFHLRGPEGSESAMRSGQKPPPGPGAPQNRMSRRRKPSQRRPSGRLTPRSATSHPPRADHRPLPPQPPTSKVTLPPTAPG